MPGLGRKIFTAGDVLTASQVQGYLQDQAVMVFAGTAARSSAIPTPSEGMVAITTDNDELDYYDGSAWVAGVPFGAWQSYTPTFTNFTLGNGVITLAKYVQIGRTVTVKVLVTLGSTSSVTGRIGFSLPVTAISENLDRNIATAHLSAGGVVGQGYVVLGTTTRADLNAQLASSTYVTGTSTGSAIPGTWAISNVWSTQFAYEALS